SSLAHLLEWGSIWFDAHWENVKLAWVKGHSGDSGNKEADRLAGTAHDSEERAWSLRLGAPPTVGWWTCWRQQPTMGKAGALIKRIEREYMAERLVAQVQATLPATGATVDTDEINDVLTALSWYMSGDGRFEEKGSFQRTSERDTSEQSLGLKLLLGNLPVMVWQMAWYPTAYPEDTMRRCPQGHPEPEREILLETQAHFLLCEAGDVLPPPAPPPGLTTRSWEHDYVCARTPWLCITKEIKREAEDAYREEREWPREKEVKLTTTPKMVQKAYRKR
ncbi:hypothetical protein IWW45_002279, partial [Coemansia sp. RSA 485]